MVAKQPNKNEARTKETRALLLKAAETIFVRDGYEVAELGEIAALAGRSKGAIYSHFESKEDLFLALFQEKNASFTARAEAAIAGSRNPQETLKIVRKYFSSLLEEEAWCLLQLEFKLFALRHPEARERLLKLYDHTPLKEREAMLASVFGPAGKGQAHLSRALAVETLAAILPSMALESEFSPQLGDKSALKKVLGVLFDALMSTDLET